MLIESIEMSFQNVYEDDKRVESYSKLDFPADYYLAYRDLPEIISDHADGNKALDFGCGTGRSTRFLEDQGFETIGIDISETMIENARELDPEGEYHRIDDGDFSQLEKDHFDLNLAAFTFDNIPDVYHRIELLKGLKELLKKDGKIILLDSTPEIYMNEWASFSTKDFPENEDAESGDKVKIIMKDVEDRRPVEDIIWFDEDYRDLFEKSDLELIRSHKTYGKKDEPYGWINETVIAPWIIYVLEK